jgi:hypothetical protein
MANVFSIRVSNNSPVGWSIPLACTKGLKPFRFGGGNSESLILLRATNEHVTMPDKAEGATEMTRRWISIRGPWGIRIGQSWGPEDFEPRLATWQRSEITQILIDAAVKKGGDMSKVRANYIVNKALALATFDKRGGITFHLRGNREAIINQICDVMALWDWPMDRTEAAGIVDRAINRRRWLKWIWIAAIVVVISIAIAIARDVR